MVKRSCCCRWQRHGFSCSLFHSNCLRIRDAPLTTFVLTLTFMHRHCCYCSHGAVAVRAAPRSPRDVTCFYSGGLHNHLHQLIEEEEDEAELLADARERERAQAREPRHHAPEALAHTHSHAPTHAHTSRSRGALDAEVIGVHLPDASATVDVKAAAAEVYGHLVERRASRVPLSSAAVQASHCSKP